MCGFRQTTDPDGLTETLLIRTKGGGGGGGGPSYKVKAVFLLLVPSMCDHKKQRHEEEAASQHSPASETPNSPAQFSQTGSGRTG